MTIKQCYKMIGKHVYVADYLGEEFGYKLRQITIRSVSNKRVNLGDRGGYHPILIFKTSKYFKLAMKYKKLYRITEIIKSKIGF